MPPCVRDASRVLFFGGSFDPPHAGHVTLPFEVARRWWGGAGAWVVYVPAARSPHKHHEPGPDRHRVEMLRLALRGRRRWWVWTQELDDAGLNADEPSYWADTWAMARGAFGTRERAFLIGTDQALAMHRWRRYRMFWRDALVMRRGDEPVEGFRAAMGETGAWTGPELDHWVSRLVETPTVDASSTAIRAAWGRGGSAPGEIPAVKRYALGHGLYRA